MTTNDPVTNRGRFVSGTGTGQVPGRTPAAPPRPAPAERPGALDSALDPATDDRAADTARHPADPAKAPGPARPRSTAGNPPALADAGSDLGSGPLLPPELASRLTGRLEHAVGSFVDDPGRAVQEADEALDETVRRLTDGLHERRTALREAWHADGDGSHRNDPDDPARTEELRLSLRAYRELLQHLLAA
ncbi:hypothetical protein OU787_30785 [Kitasatospora sp. YST-16]|uniref:hypothetical protein n=1 Tax=Kitasatospora sp. YST-16 TaxID=2998080 RepID=UPI0022848C28|nr:hypothetical protein [Kitasatospora sp. YST-16]WAL75528.1 hypothetical protein OU787_30785 [Kitasatospora sp. YST-16]WNW41594.1 hypothetical protein RKE32_30735 [Streptomyces sp. Li-HN-5-13]